ncbi:MAG: HNH endonuclease [Micavibrio aeruginosavorus]|uniref:HNH endonuclease n=1 Tax=Micavibrio aeruginosavorus TaxID=349221 RepID=A0A7T5R4K9_9BACT|nr:MAG: HNH endonuclease [Micavibrio aeruginosavorus]
MNKDSAEEPTVQSSDKSSPQVEFSSQVTPIEKKKPEDRRDIPRGLRFKVMHRDHFKCILCGDNPPATPGLVLHIDHIVPWSKGGKTEIENLRTLCAACNLGRGNRYND